MKNNFADKLIWAKNELEALKAARLRDASVLEVGSWEGSVHFDVVDWLPKKTARITIKPRNASDNMMTSLYYKGSWNECYFRVLRVAGSNGAIIYYVSFLEDKDVSQNKSFDMDIVVNYTAPATVSVDYVNDIYSY